MGRETNVTFAVEMEFDLVSGQPTEWQRLRIANFEQLAHLTKPKSASWG